MFRRHRREGCRAGQALHAPGSEADGGEGPVREEKHISNSCVQLHCWCVAQRTTLAGQGWRSLAGEPWKAVGGAVGVRLAALEL